MRKIWEWLTGSNRLKHFAGGYIIGLFSDDWYCAEYAGACVGGAMEFKDHQWGGKPDVVDFLFTVAGANAGYLTRTLIISIWQT